MAVSTSLLVRCGRRAAAVVLALFLSACAQEALLGPLNWTSSGSGVVRATDIAYGDLPRQRLDLYAPAKAERAPVILFWYGGSWQSGDKDYYRFVGRALATHGFVALIPDYRLAPESPFPNFVQDAALATRWAFDHAAVYGGDPTRIFLSGHSAGGHMALMLGLDERYLRQVQMSWDQITGVISLAGPTGLENLRGDGLRGVFPAEVPDEDFSPIRLAPRHAGAAPAFLLISGIEDDVVRAGHGARLADAIRGGSGRVTVKAYPDTGHLGLLLGFSDVFGSRDRVIRDIAAFAGLGP